MTIAANPYDERVVQRMLEFCDENTPWSRRLWQSGTMLIARELVEAGDSSRAVSGRALKTLHDELLLRVTFDIAASSPSNRAATRKMLGGAPDTLVKPGHAWYVLDGWTRDTRSEYLARWASALRTAKSLPSSECSARLITAHLLDEGLSASYLHRWLTYRVKYSSGVHTLASMCDELHTQLLGGSHSIEVLVPLAAHAPLPRPTPPGWLTSQQVRDWRRENIPDSSPIRQHGAILFTVSAMDPYAAAEVARDRITAIRDRFRVGGHRVEIRPASEMWIKSVPHPQPTEAPPRRVEVYAFERQDALWSHSVRPDLEAALELMAPLERGPAPAAVIGAWAAIEGLLVGPGDEGKHLAADRISLILAAGHLRAEWTSLAWAHADSASDELASNIHAAASNHERALLALRFVESGGGLKLIRPQDTYALERVRGAMSNSHAYVDQVRRAIQPAIHGLYRQRNLLSHAGGTSGVAIKPTLDRVAPLVAAGMDRIAHVALTSDRTALELAAVAQVRHEALRGQRTQSALALLEVGPEFSFE